MGSDDGAKGREGKGAASLGTLLFLVCFVAPMLLVEQYLVKRRGLTLAKLKDEARAVRAHPGQAIGDAVRIVEGEARDAIGFLAEGGTSKFLIGDAAPPAAARGAPGRSDAGYRTEADEAAARDAADLEAERQHMRWTRTACGHEQATNASAWRIDVSASCPATRPRAAKP